LLLRGRVELIARHMSTKTHKGKPGGGFITKSKQLIPSLSTLLVKYGKVVGVEILDKQKWGYIFQEY